MAKTLGYMITWTTYGTWLQGDQRGYVKDGRIHPKNERLLDFNKQQQLQDAVHLSKFQQQTVRDAIVKEGESRGHHIYALSVKPTHVHVVIERNPEPISKVVAYYKRAARLALKAVGHEGKLWTKGYDKRFCFDRATLRERVKYVESHNPA